jgi:folate-binding protein YgfZ
MSSQALEQTIAVTVRGADATTFMQGQLTGDVWKVSEHKATWGALCTGQGRVQALVTLSALPGGLLALLPSDLAAGLLQRLRAFTLSSKVTFEEPPWGVLPLSEAEAQKLVGELPPEPGDCRSVAEITVFRWWGRAARYLGVGPRETLPQLGQERGTAREHEWHKADVAVGLPRVFRETQGLFVPQTLNLDLLGGVSYEKGCYVGQEVVARARRGGVPRRLFGFSAQSCVPTPGAVVTCGEQEVGHVVDAVAQNGGCELLAVVDLDRAQSQLELADHTLLTPRELPYTVPLERR